MKRISKDGDLAAKAAALFGKQKLLDKKEETLSTSIRKERKKLKEELGTLMAKTLATSVAHAIRDENFGYSETEEAADPSISTPYLFSVSLERFDCEDDEDEYDDKPVRAKNKSTIHKIENYSDIMIFTKQYGLRPFRYNDFVIRFCYDAIEIESENGRDAVFNLLAEWKVPINLVRFLEETEKLETKLKGRQDLLANLQDSMLFTVGNK